MKSITAITLASSLALCAPALAQQSAPDATDISPLRYVCKAYPSPASQAAELSILPLSIRRQAFIETVFAPISDGSSIYYIFYPAYHGGDNLSDAVYCETGSGQWGDAPAITPLH